MNRFKNQEVLKHVYLRIKVYQLLTPRMVDQVPCFCETCVTVSSLLGYIPLTDFFHAGPGFRPLQTFAVRHCTDTHVPGSGTELSRNTGAEQDAEKAVVKWNMGSRTVLTTTGFYLLEAIQLLRRLDSNIDGWFLSGDP